MSAILEMIVRLGKFKKNLMGVGGGGGGGAIHLPPFVRPRTEIFDFPALFKTGISAELKSAPTKAFSTPVLALPTLRAEKLWSRECSKNKNDKNSAFWDVFNNLTVYLEYKKVTIQSLFELVSRQKCFY